MEVKARWICEKTLADGSFSHWLCVDLRDDADVAALIPVLRNLYPGKNDAPEICGDSATVIVNGRNAGLDTILREGDSISVMQVLIVGG